MSSVTQILYRIEQGDPQAADKLLPLVYDELRKLAATRMALEQPGQTLQATALVHEAYLKLIQGNEQHAWNSRGHFFGAAAEAMRRILVEEARRKRRLKRSGTRQPFDADQFGSATAADQENLLEIDEAIAKLAEQHAAKAQLVKLRYFAGLTIEEAAAALGISTATAERHWRYARAWLARQLS